MSRPANPLSEFRSYAYHHIFVVSNTTAGVIDAASNPDLDLGFDPSFPVRSGSTGKYMVLINGTQTARFYIKSLRTKTIPGATFGCSSPSFSTEAQMVIVEPLGVRFLNVIALAVSSLKVDPAIL
ncbi:MAG: hypothetical protein ACREAU_03620, partial [Nitrosopumilaceae archaeon]